MRPIDMLLQHVEIPQQYASWTRTQLKVGAIAYTITMELGHKPELYILTYSPMSDFNVMCLPREYTKAFFRWLDREGPIQTVMPMLTTNEREQIISGIMPDEYPRAM